jgi:hypothetical protein
VGYSIDCRPDPPELVEVDHYVVELEPGEEGFGDDRIVAEVCARAAADAGADPVAFGGRVVSRDAATPGRVVVEVRRRTSIVVVPASPGDSP